jgi:hypothetical protein
VRHCESKIMDRGRVIADARQILIDIPTLDAEHMRQGWCQRFPRKAETTLPLASILPDWNPRIQSLSMKFLHSKVSVVAHATGGSSIQQPGSSSSSSSSSGQQQQGSSSSRQQQPTAE